MIFNELYGVYYNTVAKLLAMAVTGELTEKRAREIISESAFPESERTILPSLEKEKWQLLNRDMTTPLKRAPTMPLTLLEKRWLKAILLDERIALFDIVIDGLDGVDPLFCPKDYFIYDRCVGDNFSDEGYTKRFRLILDAIHKSRPLRFELTDRNGESRAVSGVPQRLEYSERHDKFRVALTNRHGVSTLELGRLTDCRPHSGDTSESSEYPSHESSCPSEIRSVTLTITGGRIAAKQVLMRFAHFEKMSERVDGKHYRLHIKYSEEDESELVMRVLSLGPLVRADEPQRFTELIRARLLRQSRSDRI